MKRITVVAGALTLGLVLQAAEGKRPARATLQTRSGATVASAQADPNGMLRFTNVAPGDYRIVLTSPDGRSVTVDDVDGDGVGDIVIEGKAAAASMSTAHLPPSSADGTTLSTKSSAGAGSGKVNVQDLSMTKAVAKPGGAPPSVPPPPPGVVPPRDTASGMPTGKRQHKPMVCLVDWDLAKGKGGYASERAAQTEGQQLPPNASGRCVVTVVVDAQPGTIEISSSSVSEPQAADKHTKTGHVTLMK